MKRTGDAPELRTVVVPDHPPVAIRSWAGMGPGLLLVHGFLGSSRSWIRPVAALSWPGPVVAVDLPGHGRSPGWADGRGRRAYAIPDVARLLGTLQEELFPSPPVWLGYSMGGRIAIAAAAQGVPMRALLLESASPGIVDPALRAARRTADEERATELLRRGTRAFVDSWLTLPLFQGLDTLPTTVREDAVDIRAGQDARAMAAWLREAGAGTQPWYGEELARLALPVRVLVGERDGKYTALWNALVPTLRDGALQVARDVGHVPHLEDVEVWARWVDAARSGPGSDPGIP